jgi:hypothetical protein
LLSGSFGCVVHCRVIPFRVSFLSFVILERSEESRLYPCVILERSEESRLFLRPRPLYVVAVEIVVLATIQAFSTETIRSSRMSSSTCSQPAPSATSRDVPTVHQPLRGPFPLIYRASAACHFRVPFLAYSMPFSTRTQPGDARNYEFRIAITTRLGVRRRALRKIRDSSLRPE